MKIYLRLAALIAVVGLFLVVFLVFRQASAPESAIIAREKDNLSATVDRNRMATDAVYAFEMQERLDFLDYRLAVAYNKENRPDEAAAVLDKLISGEEAKKQGAIPRRARSYQAEANYYEALEESYRLKHDPARQEKASGLHDQLAKKAGLALEREQAEEGKHVGAVRE